MTSRLSAATPIPVSITVNCSSTSSASPASRSTRIRTLPCSVNFTAARPSLSTDRRERALRRADGRVARAWGGGDLVKIGPTAKDLSKGLYQYHLDFPGNALAPGCDYLHWQRRLTAGQAPSVYAHVATDPAHPGKLALQYWLFYVFNDWNNLHEGDWEMIQLVFDASTRGAGSGASADRGRVQPARGRRTSRLERRASSSSWREPIRSCILRPGRTRTSTTRRSTSAARPSKGSAATTPAARRSTFARWSDDPQRPAQARAEFPWIAFEGRWGELQPAFFNGPTGPNLKTQWTEPIAWSDDWRDAQLHGAVGRRVRRHRDRLLLRRGRKRLESRSFGSSTVRSSSRS